MAKHRGSLLGMKKGKWFTTRNEPPVLVYTLNESSRGMKISLSTTKRLISEGKLRVIRVGRRVLIRREDLEEFLRTGVK
jgi:excisionase family DNA binding protein